MESSSSSDEVANNNTSYSVIKESSSSSDEVENNNTSYSVIKGSSSSSDEVALLSGSGSKQRRIKLIAFSDSS